MACGHERQARGPRHGSRPRPPRRNFAIPVQTLKSVAKKQERAQGSLAESENGQAESKDGPGQDVLEALATEANEYFERKLFPAIEPLIREVKSRAVELRDKFEAGEKLEEADALGVHDE